MAQLGQARPSPPGAPGGKAAIISPPPPLKVMAVNGQGVRAAGHRAAHLRALGSQRLVRPERSRCPLLHHDPAPERHRDAAHGACLPAHPHGHPHPLPAHARCRRPVATGHRPCRHRHADGGRAPAERTGHQAHRADARGLHRARLAVEGAVRGQHRRTDAPPGRLGRLESRSLHDRPAAVARGDRGLRAPARGGPDLPRQAPGELGPGAAHRAVRPGGAVAGGGRPAVAPALSLR